MGSWCVYLFCILLCATGRFYGSAHVQTEENKSKYLPYMSTMEDGDEKQLVSCMLHLLSQSKFFQDDEKVVDFYYFFFFLHVYFRWKLFSCFLKMFP